MLRGLMLVTRTVAIAQPLDLELWRSDNGCLTSPLSLPGQPWMTEHLVNGVASESIWVEHLGDELSNFCGGRPGNSSHTSVPLCHLSVYMKSSS